MDKRLKIVPEDYVVLRDFVLAFVRANFAQFQADLQRFGIRGAVFKLMSDMQLAGVVDFNPYSDGKLPLYSYLSDDNINAAILSILRDADIL